MTTNQQTYIDACKVYDEINLMVQGSPPSTPLTLAWRKALKAVNLAKENLSNE